MGSYLSENFEDKACSASQHPSLMPILSQNGCTILTGLPRTLLVDVDKDNLPTQKTSEKLVKDIPCQNVDERKDESKTVAFTHGENADNPDNSYVSLSSFCYQRASPDNVI